MDATRSGWDTENGLKEEQAVNVTFVCIENYVVNLESISYFQFTEDGALRVALRGWPDAESILIPKSRAGKYRDLVRKISNNELQPCATEPEKLQPADGPVRV
jgi:hypothetical protein